MKKIHLTIVMCAACILLHFNVILAQKASTPNTKKVQPTTTWDGISWSNGKPTELSKAIFANDFNANENITALDIEVLDGAKLTIEDKKTLTVINALKVAPTAKLTLIENAQLIQKNPQSPNAVVDVVRLTGWINKFDYTYFSSPVENQQLNLIGDPSQFLTYINTNGGGSYLPPLFDKYYVFNSSATPQGTDVNMFSSGAWQNIPENTVVNTPGLGFIVRGPNSFPNTAPTQQWQVKFTGEPYTGTQTRAISGSAYSPFIGALTQITSPPTFPYKPCENPLYALNLIGNPYTSMISADAFLTLPANITNLDGALYFWTHKNGPTSANGGNGTAPLNYTNNDYVVYNLVGGVGGTNRPVGTIATCQGFVVRGLSNNVATFTDDMTTTSGTDQMYRTYDLNNILTTGQSDRITASSLTTPMTKNRFWISMEGSGSNAPYRETLIGYMPTATTANDNILSSIPGSTNNFEKMYDVEIFKPVYNTYSNGSNDLTNRFELYSIINPTTPCPRLVIQGRKLDATFNTNDVVQLGFTCPAGTYTIKGFNSEGLFSSQQYWLKETVNGVSNYYNIRNTPYTFTVTTAVNDNSTRFAIVFSLPTTANINSNLCNTTISGIWDVFYFSAVTGVTSYHIQAVPTNTSLPTIQFDTTVPRFQIAPFGFSYNTTYQVLVATYQVDGQWVYNTTPCTFTTPASPKPSSIFDPACGSVLVTRWHSIRATQLEGMAVPPTSYQFIVTVGGVDYTFTTANSSFQLPQVPGLPILPNTVYTVRVNVNWNNTVIIGTTSCNVITPNNVTNPRLTNEDISIFEVKASPNPFVNTFNLNINSTSTENLELSVYDMLGRTIESKTIGIYDIDYQELGANYTSGIYNITVKQGQSSKSLRVIKQ